MSKPVRGTLSALALTGLLTACATQAPAAQLPPLDGTEWVLAGLPGRTLVGDSSVTLQFAGDRVTGSDGCNRYSGGYSVKGAVLTVGPQLAATQMACPPEVMAQAQAFVSALTAARSYRVKDGRLELLSADGATRATLTAQPRALAGTAWHVTGINNGRGGVASVVKDSSVTMAFGPDGVASGSAGCNQYTTRFQTAGPQLTFAQPAVTRKMCARPDGVMEQEQQFLSALATVTSARREGDRLELRTASGALAISLSQMSP